MRQMLIFLVEVEVPREDYLAGISESVGEDAREPWKIGTNSQVLQCHTFGAHSREPADIRY